MGVWGVPADFGDVTTVPNSFNGFRILLDWGVSEHADFTKVISSSNQLHAVDNRFVRPITVVDVGTILTRLPDALSSPCQHTAVSCPGLVAVIAGARSNLLSALNLVEKQLIGAIIGSYGSRVQTPV